jgi:2-keto-3-deoxy-L-rhamnonate aldolase RhmA
MGAVREPYMATLNRVKQKFGRREVAHGVWMSWLEPALVEFYGLLGFDYVLIDGEHVPVERESCLQLVRACEVAGIVPMLRVPDGRPSLILGYLDLGVQGIYVPHVSTADQATQIVEAVKYAPKGRRGAALGRAAGYGLAKPPDEYFRQANEDTIVIALVEDKEGIDNLDEILAVDGVDVVGVGDNDLSHSMGFPGQKDHPDVRTVVEQAEARIASRRVLDAVVSSVEQAEGSIRAGALMISLSDSGFMAPAFASYLTKLAKLTVA